MNDDWKSGFTGAILAAKAKASEFNTRANASGPLDCLLLRAKEEAVKELVTDLETILEKS